MVIKSVTQIDTTIYGYKKHGHTYAIVVEVNSNNAQNEANSILTIITNMSWTTQFDAIDQESLKACAKPTIQKIVDSVLNKVGNTIEKEFGEYLVSYSAQLALESKLYHVRIPLSELFKEKISGNPGFDFHTVSPNTLVVFGEAKYNSKKTPYDDAEGQINDFLKPTPEYNKHLKELKEIRRFVGDAAAQNVVNGKIGIAAAFSIHAKDASLAMKNAIKYPEFKNLLSNEEIYVIGVHII